MSIILLAILVFLPICNGRLDGQVITTAVGTDYTVSADGKQALSIPLGEFGSVAVDLNGNVYLASAVSNVVLRMGTNGIVTSFAGNGIAGFSGDGGQAQAAA